MPVLVPAFTGGDLRSVYHAAKAFGRVEGKKLPVLCVASFYSSVYGPQRCYLYVLLLYWYWSEIIAFCCGPAAGKWKHFAPPQLSRSLGHTNIHTCMLYSLCDPSRCRILVHTYLIVCSSVDYHHHTVYARRGGFHTHLHRLSKFDYSKKKKGCVCQSYLIPNGTYFLSAQRSISNTTLLAVTPTHSLTHLFFFCCCCGEILYRSISNTIRLAVTLTHSLTHSSSFVAAVERHCIEVRKSALGACGKVYTEPSIETAVL